jgi:hypothetical protein
MLTYIYALVILAFVLAAHIFGLTGAYVAYSWYDIMMHVLGGVGIALFVAALIKLHGQNIVHKRLFIIAAVFIVGLGWELFEIYYQLTGYPLWSKMHYIDSIKDLIDDTIGAIIVSYIVIRKN